MIPLRKPLTLAAFAALAIAAHSQTTVYGLNTFSGTNPTAGFTSSDLTIGTRTDNGETWLGTSNTGGNNYYGFGTGTATLSLANLPAHSSVTISFDLYMTGSEDGNGPAGNGVDPWSLSQTGSTTTNLIATNFANYNGGGNTQDFGGPNGSGGYLTGGTYAPRTGQSAENHLGFDTTNNNGGGSNFGDATYSLSFTFASTSAAQSFAFARGNSEGANNEGWGLDNVKVTIVPTATPEPAPFAALGLGAVALLRRRRKA